jgi:hypothetical protein
MESLSPENRAAFILRRPDNSPVNALAAFIEGAGRVQPPTEGVLNVFKLGARDHIETPGVPEALARVFTAGRSNSQYILNHLTNFDSKSNSSITDDRVQMLTNFFRKTIFSDPASLDSSVLLDPAVKNEIVEESRQFVSSLRAQIENNPNPDVPRMMRLARQAGHVVGALVGAFNETLKDYADEDAAHDRRVGNAVTVASTIAALAGPEAHWAVKGGVKVGSVVLKKFLQGQPPVGERELEQYESLLQNDFDGFDSGLNIPGLPRRIVTDIENELVDGANEALTKWAENEGVLRDPLGN